MGNAAAVLPRRLPVTEACSAPLPPLPPTAMKYERGRCLVVAGSDRYPGAAHLALRGAMASGCGCVQAVVPPRLQSSLWQVLPEVMQLEDGVIPERLDAVLVGPGLGEPTIGGTSGRSRCSALLVCWCSMPMASMAWRPVRRGGVGC